VQVEQTPISATVATKFEFPLYTSRTFPRVLLDAIGRLFTENFLECTWLDEPGEFRWKFVRNNLALHVKVAGIHKRVHPKEGWSLGSETVLFQAIQPSFISSLKWREQLRHTLDKWGLRDTRKSGGGRFQKTSIGVF